MKLGEWPIYISDTFHVECNEAACDEEFDHPGRRVTVADLLRVIREHAKDAHGIELKS